MHVPKPFLLIALLGVLVWGTAAQDDPIKIGVVDIDQAFASTQEGKSAREELQRKQREAEAKIQPMIEEFRSMEDDLQQKRFALSEEALYNRQLDLAQKRNEIETRMKELEVQFQVDQKRLEGPLLKKMLGVIETEGKNAGFTMILRRGSSSLLYTREALDITDLIIEKYNQSS